MPEVLDTMTTETLAEVILHYPLNYLIFVYNNPLDVVNLVLRNSELHKAFIRRPDAARVIVDLFSQTELDFYPGENKNSSGISYVSFENELFMEYLIYSGLIPGVFSGNCGDKLLLAALNKLERRESNSSIFSKYSKLPLMGLAEQASSEQGATISLLSNDVQTSHYALSYSNAIAAFSTFFKQSLIGYYLDELTETELNYITNICTSAYSDAIVRGPATSRYNCHSYAWHSNSTTNRIWLNATYDNSLQLSKYWTNDLYVSCPQSSAEKVYYSSGDHSAIVLQNGKYLSKWGAGPLMEHDYNDCPYDTTNLLFFAERTTPLYNFTTVTGNSPIYVNQSNMYSFNPDYDMNVSVRLLYMTSDAYTPYSLSQTAPGVYSLTCYEPGFYNMYVEGYRNGNCIASVRKDIIVWNN